MSENVEAEAVPKTKEECEAAGGRWDAEKNVCIVKEDIAAKYEGLKKLYDELNANLANEADKEAFPSFEDWVKYLESEYKHAREVADKYKYRYPLYPYYPYRGYPEKPKTEENLPQGSGIVQESQDDHFKQLEAISESLKSTRTIREQWHPVCVDVTTKEPTGHLRDICMLSQVIKGKAGDVVNIPYVKDFDFEILANVGDAFSAETTGLVGSVATTLKEAGFYTSITYADIEKLDANLLAKLEEKCRVAALRAEDHVILDALLEDTNVTESDQSAHTAFDADFVEEAIRAMRMAGKDIGPGMVVLVLSPRFYGQLVKDVLGSMNIMFAMPEAAKRMVTQFLEAEIRIAGYLPEWDTTNHYVSAYLIRKNATVAFAPKRDLLIETEKITKDRKLQVTGSHTFARVVIDAKNAVEIKVTSVL